MTTPDWYRNWEVSFVRKDTGEHRTDHVQADNQEEAIALARESHAPGPKWKLTVASRVIDMGGGQAPGAAEPPSMTLNAAQLELVRQWFNQAQDTASPGFLERTDFALARELYEKLGIRVPHSIMRELEPDNPQYQLHQSPD